jgi:hypothetical protein
MTNFPPGGEGEQSPPDLDRWWPAPVPEAPSGPPLPYPPAAGVAYPYSAAPGYPDGASPPGLSAPWPYPTPGRPADGAPGRRSNVWMIALVAMSALLVVAVLVAVAIPTFLSIKRGPVSDGTTWFERGVPSDWSPSDIGNLSGGSVLEAAWQTPGPVVSGFYPCVYVSQLQFARGATLNAGDWLASVAAAAHSEGWQVDRIGLADGAPALAAYMPSVTDNSRTSHNVAISMYRIFAQHGTGFYSVTFMTPVDNYATEQTAVSSVMSTFIGSGTAPVTAN